MTECGVRSESLPPVQLQRETPPAPREPKSWGEALRMYEAEKRAPIHSKTSSVQRVTREQISERERDFHPILQVHCDVKKEAKRCERERIQRRERIRSAEQRERAYQKEREGEVKPKRHVGTMLKSQGSYDILTNIPICVEEPRQQRQRSAPMAGYRKIKPELPQELAARPFNIVNNCYVKDHEEKSQHDRETEQQIAKDRFWATHDFNAIRGEYYSSEKDRLMVAQEEREREERRLYYEVHLPPTAKQCESRLYDPITLKVLDEPHVEKMDAEAEKARTRKAHRSKDALEQRMKKQLEDREEKADRMRIARFGGHQRVRASSTDTPRYNIITLGSCSPTFVPPSKGLARCPRTLWDNVEAELNRGVPSLRPRRNSLPSLVSSSSFRAPPPSLAVVRSPVATTPQSQGNQGRSTQAAPCVVRTGGFQRITCDA